MEKEDKSVSERIEATIQTFSQDDKEQDLLSRIVDFDSIKNEKDNYIIVGSYDGDELVGVAIARILREFDRVFRKVKVFNKVPLTKQKFFVKSLVVKNSYHGYGIGSVLLNELENYIKNLNGGVIIVPVLKNDSDNIEKAERLMIKNNYSSFDVVDGFWSGSEDGEHLNNLTNDEKKGSETILFSKKI